MTLDEIVQLLSSHRQRATYGAVAALVGATPRSLMQGRSRNWLNSWIVNQETGRPSEYPEPKVHPQLETRDRILDTVEDLQAWLQAPK